MDVDADEKKMTVSCSVKSVGSSVETMTRCIKTMLSDQRTAGAWCQHSVGDNVDAEVKSVSEFGALLDIAGTRGVLTTSNMSGAEVSEGSRVSGVVVFVDSRMKLVEISCNQELINKMKRKKKKKHVVKEGDVVKGRVVMNKSEYGLALFLITEPASSSGVLGTLSTINQRSSV